MTELKDFKISADGALEKYIGRENRVIVPEGVRSALADAFCGADTAFLSLPASFSCEDISFIDGILALEEISVHPENPVFSSLDGVLYNKDKTELLRCPPKKTGELIIPNTVLRFSGSAFKKCALLESIRISESVTEIGMGDGLFGCYAEISVDSGNPSFLSHGGIVYSIDEETVVLCSRGKTGEIYIPHSVSAVGCSAFAFCDRLTAIRFGTDVELCLGDNAFLGCSALSELIIPQNTYGNTEYMRALFGLSVSVVVDGSYLCPEFSIRSGIFERVKSIYFTASYEEAISTELLKLYLEETEGEASLYFTDANGGYTPFLPPTDENGNYKLPTGFVIVRGELVEYNGREREVRIPSDGSVTSLGSSLFDCWYMLSDEEPLKSVNIPASVNRIAHDAFYNSFISDRITVDDGNPVYKTACNCLIDTRDGTLIKACLNGSIPDDGSVSSIGFGAFWGNQSLKSLSVPTSVTHIGNEAFAFCSLLEKVSLPSSVRSIGIEAFFGCDKLKEVIIEGDTVICSNAFEGCKGVTLFAKEGSSAFEYATKKGLKVKTIK